MASPGRLPQKFNLHVPPSFCVRPTLMPALTPTIAREHVLPHPALSLEAGPPPPLPYASPYRFPYCTVAPCPSLIQFPLHLTLRSAQEKRSERVAAQVPPPIDFYFLHLPHFLRFARFNAMRFVYSCIWLIPPTLPIPEIDSSKWKPPHPAPLPSAGSLPHLSAILPPSRRQYSAGELGFVKSFWNLTELSVATRCPK